MRTIDQSIAVIKNFCTENYESYGSVLCAPIITCSWNYETDKCTVRARIYRNGFGFTAVKVRRDEAFDYVASKVQAFNVYREGKKYLEKVRNEYRNILDDTNALVFS